MNFFCTLVAACALLGPIAYAQDGGKKDDGRPIFVEVNFDSEVTLGDITRINSHMELPTGYHKTISTLSVKLEGKDNPNLTAAVTVTLTTQSLTKEDGASFLAKEYVRIEKDGEGYRLVLPKSSAGDGDDYFLSKPQQAIHYNAYPFIHHEGEYYAKGGTTMAFTNLKLPVVVTVDDLISCRLIAEEAGEPCGVDPKYYRSTKPTPVVSEKPRVQKT